MRRLAPLLAVLLGLASPLRAGGSGAGGILGAGELARLLPGDREVAGAWGIVEEAAEDLGADPDFRRRGLRASQARHYTRARGPVSEVCSVELWAFDDAAQAAAAGASLSLPGWRVDAEGKLLVLLHGVRHERGARPRAGLVPGCEELGELTRRRIRERR